MEVVAFVGPSGTGKSHRAIGVAHNNNCDAIIDDGLLIKGTKILAYGGRPRRCCTQRAGDGRHTQAFDTGYFR